MFFCYLSCHFAFFFFFFFNDTATTEIYTLPYTTLFRSRRGWPPARAGTGGSPGYSSTIRTSPSSTRSEEHTSELQSRQYLVCRLLLEKKKKKLQYDPRKKKKNK